MRSASLLRSRARSNPVTFFPHVVWRALRAAATATSMSFAEATRKHDQHAIEVSSEQVLRLPRRAPVLREQSRHSPATTEQSGCSVAGLMHSMVSCESTDGTNWLLMKRPVWTPMVLPVGTVIFATEADILGCALVDDARWRGTRRMLDAGINSRLCAESRTDNESGYDRFRADRRRLPCRMRICIL